MMTMMLRVVLIVVSVITMTFMMRKIRQAKVQIEAAMFWVIMALLLVIFAVMPGVADLKMHHEPGILAGEKRRR